jgi:excisionase family DNA binding protein
MLGASRCTIQRLIAKGTLKAGKIGSRCIIQRTEIDKLFK